MRLARLRIVLWKVVPTLVAVAAGYAGGALQSRWNDGSVVEKVRAGQFELVDRTGRVAGIWRMSPPTSGGADGEVMLEFIDRSGVKRARLGMVGGDSAAALNFYGSDRTERVALRFGMNGDPVLVLGDGQRVRASFGADHGDIESGEEDQWSLRLRGRNERAGASIGFHRWWDGKYRAGISLSDGAGSNWQASAGPEMKPLPLVGPVAR